MERAACRPRCADDCRRAPSSSRDEMATCGTWSPRPRPQQPGGFVEISGIAGRDAALAKAASHSRRSSKVSDLVAGDGLARDAQAVSRARAGWCGFRRPARAPPPPAEMTKAPAPASTSARYAAASGTAAWRPRRTAASIEGARSRKERISAPSSPMQAAGTAWPGKSALHGAVAAELALETRLLVHRDVDCQTSGRTACAQPAQNAAARARSAFPDSAPRIAARIRVVHAFHVTAPRMRRPSTREPGRGARRRSTSRPPRAARGRACRTDQAIHSAR